MSINRSEAGVLPADGARASAGRRWAWLLTLLVGVGLFELVRRALVDTGNPNLLPALILLGAAVVPAAFVAFVYGRRLGYDVPGLLHAGIPGAVPRSCLLPAAASRGRVRRRPIPEDAKPLPAAGGAAVPRG